MNTDIYMIIKQYENFIFSIINKFSYCCDEEDLYQEAIKGVIKAYKNYNKSSNVKFSTYMYKYV